MEFRLIKQWLKLIFWKVTIGGGSAISYMEDEQTLLFCLCKNNYICCLPNYYSVCYWINIEIVIWIIADVFVFKIIMELLFENVLVAAACL